MTRTPNLDLEVNVYQEVFTSAGSNSLATNYSTDAVAFIVIHAEGGTTYVTFDGTAASSTNGFMLRNTMNLRLMCPDDFKNIMVNATTGRCVVMYFKYI